VKQQLLTTLVSEFSASKESSTVPFLKWNIEAIPQAHKEKIQKIVLEIETTELYRLVNTALEEKGWCSANPNECIKGCEGQSFSMTKAHLLTVLLWTVVPRASPDAAANLKPLFEFDLLPGSVRAEIESLQMGWDGLCEIAEAAGACCGTL